MIVRNVITRNIKLNPKTKDKISVFLLSIRTYPISNGITGNTQGDNTEAIPARNDIIGAITI